MVKVEVGIDHMCDLRRSHPQTRQLAHDIVADLGTDGKARRPAFAQTSDRISDRVAVHTGIKEHPAVGVDEEMTGHRDGHARPRVTVREKDVTVKLQKAATQGIDLYHRSHPW